MPIAEPDLLESGCGHFTLSSEFLTPNVLQEVSSTTWKVWFAVIVAAVCSVVLLWVLFGRDDAEMVCTLLYYVSGFLS